MLCEIDVQATLKEKLGRRARAVSDPRRLQSPRRAPGLEQSPSWARCCHATSSSIATATRRISPRSTPSGCSHRRQRQAHPGGDRGERATGERRSPSSGRQEVRMSAPAATNSRVGRRSSTFRSRSSTSAARRVAARVAGKPRSNHAAARDSRTDPTTGAPRTSSSLRPRRAWPSPSRGLRPGRGSSTRGLNVEADGVAGMRPDERFGFTRLRLRLEDPGRTRRRTPAGLPANRPSRKRLASRIARPAG